MKRVICDNCRAETEPDAYGLAPTGWLTVNVRGQNYPPAADYCSPGCAIAALTPVPTVTDVPAMPESVQ